MVNTGSVKNTNKTWQVQVYRTINKFEKCLKVLKTKNYKFVLGKTLIWCCSPTIKNIR